MARPRNHYEVLGLKPGASILDIRQAYRRLAMALHPDRNPDEPLAVELFQKLSEAYNTLRDDAERSAYDRKIASQEVDPDYAMFQTVEKPTTVKTAGPVAKRGENLRHPLEVDLDALKNAPTIREYRYTRMDRCPDCRGSGHEPATQAKPIACPSCGASGLIDKQSGNVKLRQPCPDCHSGYIFKADACQTCLGAGRVATKRKIEITIPSGTHPDTPLRIPRGGHAGPWGGDFGDLILDVKLAMPEGVTLKGEDLHVTLPLDPISLIAGTDVVLPNGGRIVIAPATRPGERIVIKKKGLPKKAPAKDHGDLIIQIELEWPLVLSPKQIKLLREVSQTLDVAKSTPGFDGAKKLLGRLNKKH